MDKLLLYNLARMYYIDGLGQQEIANVTGMSRPQISRLLKEARSRNIVEITLNPPYDASETELGGLLRERLALREARVVSTADYALSNLEERTRTVANYAAEYLSALFPACRKVGVGWGQTIYATVLAMEHSMQPLHTLFVPLLGNAGFSHPYYQTNSIVDRLAEKFKAKALFINTPAFVTSEVLKRYLFELNGLDQRDGAWDGIDMAFFSLGGAPRTRSVARDIPAREVVEKLLASAAVGDVLGSYFDRDGKPILEADSTWCVTMPLEKLRQIPRRVCVALGEEKAEAILTAAEMGCFTELLTDHYTAMEILSRTEQPI